MFESQCDLGAIVYRPDERPDQVLAQFADGLAADGFRAVGLVQQSRSVADGRDLSVTLVHSGRQMRLFQDLGAGAKGCKLDVSQLLKAGADIDEALTEGADLLVINRFGKQELEGQGLLFLIDRALGEQIPVLIAVPEKRLASWIDFSGEMSVRLTCDLAALSGWWNSVAGLRRAEVRPRSAVCEVSK